MMDYIDLISSIKYYFSMYLVSSLSSTLGSVG